MPLQSAPRAKMARQNAEMARQKAEMARQRAVRWPCLTPQMPAMAALMEATASMPKPATVPARTAGVTLAMATSRAFWPRRPLQTMRPFRMYLRFLLRLTWLHQTQRGRMHPLLAHRVPTAHCLTTWQGV